MNVIKKMAFCCAFASIFLICIDSALPNKFFIEPNTGIEFVWIPTGCFRMGMSPEYQLQLIAEEKRLEGENHHDNLPKILNIASPDHEVCVDGFWMSKYEITNKQYRLYTPSHDSGYFGQHNLNNDEQPVVNVSWQDSTSYAGWLSDKSGKIYRLPTEAEWEYAARGGTVTLFYWGNTVEPVCSFANIADSNAKEFASYFEHRQYFNCNDHFSVTAKVGSFRPNNFGLYDMIGNVSEWCQDWRSRDYYSVSPRNNPQGPSYTAARVLRGGSWTSHLPRLASPSFRSSCLPEAKMYNIGFRLVLNDESQIKSKSP